MFFIRHTHVGTDDGSLGAATLVFQVGPVNILHSTNGKARLLILRRELSTTSKPLTSTTDQTAVFHKPNMSLKTTVEIVVDGHPTKCTVEVPLAALSLNGDPSHVTALDVADFAATTTAEVTKAVRRQASDFGVENPAINALDANVEECDSLGTGTGYDDAIRKEGHLNFSQGSSAAPSPEHDVNKDWFRNARTKKFVEAQTALGLGTASSTLQPLQDGTCEYRSSSDLVQPTSNRSYNRQGDCTACDEGYCWDHPPRCVDSQELLKNTNCGRSSIPLYDNVAQPSPSDWGRDDRISQSGGDWENGLGFTPPSEIQAESNVQPASDIEEGTDAQNIKVYVTNGLFKERCYKIKSTRALTGLFEDVSADFGTLLCGIMHLREGIVIKPNGTAEEVSLVASKVFSFLTESRTLSLMAITSSLLKCGSAVVGRRSSGKGCKDADLLAALKEIVRHASHLYCRIHKIKTASQDVTQDDRPMPRQWRPRDPDEVAQRLQTVTCGLTSGLIKAVQGQAEAEEIAKDPEEIENLASKEYFCTANTAITGRLPSILNCAASGEVTVTFNFRFETHVTMCRIGLTREFYEAMEAFASRVGQPLEELRISRFGDRVRFHDGSIPVDQARLGERTSRMHKQHSLSAERRQLRRRWG
ncbi:hypothetical protein KC327_g29 [Hortaea werneckii]|nr:hypothetical protein KC327_g29 [Hortaea werneckii]